MALSYGLQGAEDAILTGTGYGLNQLGQTSDLVGMLYGQGQQQLGAAQQGVEATFDRGIAQLAPYQQAGAGASGIQAAMSGAMGPQAQSQAMQQYQESPFLDAARQNAERAITRNAAATGNLGSGNTLDQLFQNAAGMFLQDYNNRFAQLGGIADRGMGAAGTEAGLRAQQGGVQANLGQAGANISTQQAGVQANLGQMASQMPVQAGRDIAGYRTQAGRDIAQAAANTTSTLANLINQQGAGASDIVGNYANNINALYQQAAQGDANAQEQLAAMLANMSVQSGSMVSGLPQQYIQPPSMLGQVGQLASGIGAMLPYMYPQQQAATSPSLLPGALPPPIAPYPSNYSGLPPIDYGVY